MIINSFKSSIVTYLNPANHYPARITKTEKDFGKKLDFKDMNFPVKIRDNHKIEKYNSISISVFYYENKENIQSMYQKNVAKKIMLIYY